MDAAFDPVLWNRQGRTHTLRINRALSDLYEDDRETDGLDAVDPRLGDAAERALAEVIAMNRAGLAETVRNVLDAPIGALADLVSRNATPLSMAIIDGDQISVRQGNVWGDVTTWRLRGTSAEVVPGVIAMAISADRSVIATVDVEGVTTTRAGHVIHRWPAPDNSIVAEVDGTAWPLGIEHLAVSNDGTRVAMAAYRAGVLVGSARPGDEPWRRIHPSERPPFEDSRGADDRFDDCADMVHCDLSPDGATLAVGHQMSDHYLIDLDADPDEWLVARLGRATEYPHHCRFSTDGRFVAFNSCHFYDGGTISFDRALGRGIETLGDEPDPRTPLIDDSLRVYGSAWVPPGVVDPEGLFCLHGVGVLRAVTPTGRLVFAQTVPASGGAMDFEPSTGRLVVGGYSGMLHVLDMAAAATEARGEEGWRPRVELQRWFLWPQTEGGPFVW